MRYSLFAGLMTVLPRYCPQEAQAVCGSTISPQFGQVEDWTGVKKS
jgi:hypothetical protein